MDLTYLQEYNLSDLRQRYNAAAEILDFCMDTFPYTIANDLRAQFAQNFMGIVDNTEDGRRQYKSAIVKYLTQLQASGGIQNFDAENDVIVEKGEAKDAVLITLAIEAVGSTNKIYITLEVA